MSTQKWKCILTNWLNCYFNESIERQVVNTESLLGIMSHLRQNLCLDESISSKLEAHTLEQFIQEKYPEFIFENGSVEAASDDDIYVIASLLLFFVCVNSKDTLIKNAMCSKLSVEDQEIILKFSKILMECASVTLTNVHAAIIEACGQKTVLEVTEQHAPVAETPPALRSLHSEVRRLQAALDAERFDRSFLQEELTRTNMKLDKLSKDKEQYKLDIVLLKAKISNCCGEEAEAHKSDLAANKTSAKFYKQLEELEERLIETSILLDDTISERDIYKAKVDDLKVERDKWISTSQEEHNRASALNEQLLLERRSNESLKELVAELRLHNRHNGLDASQLECDDLETSIHSLGHNTSVCNEACANVIEVQLGEERAKIIEMQKQIDILNSQLAELTWTTNEEKIALDKLLTEKDAEIENCKHCINEEKEKQLNLNATFNDEVSKLNNEMNELEQKITVNNENYHKELQQKMQEIQILQEEKLSLLQSFSDETTKLETKIKEMDNAIHVCRNELIKEQNSKCTMKENYECHIMKLNEKISNRNNELVDLQNNILAQSEMIECVSHQLRKEKDCNEELIAKHAIEVADLNRINESIKNELAIKTDAVIQMTKQLEGNISNITELKQIINEMENVKDNLLKEHSVLIDSQKELMLIIDDKTSYVEKLQNQLDTLHNKYSEDKQSLEMKLTDNESTILSLKEQFDDVCKINNDSQNNIKTLNGIILKLKEENEHQNLETFKLKEQLNYSNKEMDAIVKQNEQMIKDNEKELVELKNNKIVMDEVINRLKTENDHQNLEMLNVKEQLEHCKKEMDTIVKQNEQIIKDNEKELLELKNSKMALDEVINTLKGENKHQNLEMLKLKEQLEHCNKEKDTIVNQNEQITKDIEKELLELKNNKMALDEVINTLKGENKHQNLEMLKLKEQLEHCNKEMDTIGKQNEQITKNNEKELLELKNNKMALDEVINTLKGENEHQNLDMLKLEEQLEYCNKEMDTIIKQNEQITKDNEIELLELKNNKIALDEVINTLKGENEHQNLEMLKLEEQLEHCNKEMDTIIKQNEQITKDNEKELLELKNNKMALDEVINTLKGENEHQNLEMLKLKEQLEHCNKEKDIIVKQNEQNEKIIMDNNNEIVQLKNNEMTLNEKIKMLKGESEHHKLEMFKLMEQLEHCYKELDKIIKQNEQNEKIISDNNKELVELKNKEISLNDTIKTLKKENEDQNLELFQLMEQHEYCNKELNKIVKHNEQNEKIIKDNVQGLLELKNTEIAMDEIIKTLKDENQRHDSKIIELNTFLKESNNKINEMGKVCEQKEELLKVIQGELSKEKICKDEITFELLSVIAEKEQLIRKLNKNNNEILALNDEIKKLFENIENKETETKNLHEKLNHEENKYLQLQNDFETEISLLKSKISETEVMMKDISTNNKQKLENKSNEVQKLNVEIENLKENLGKCSNTIEIIQKEKDYLAQNLEEETLSREKLDKEYKNQLMLNIKLKDDIELKINSIESLKAEHENLISEMQNKEKDLTILKKQIDDMMEEKNCIYSTTKIELNSLEEKLQKSFEEKYKLVTLNEELTKKIEGLDQTIQVMEETNNSLEIAIKDTIVDYEHKLNEKEENINKLEQELLNESSLLTQLTNESIKQTQELEELKVENKVQKELMIGKLYEQVSLLNCFINYNVIEEKVIKPIDVSELYEGTEEIDLKKALLSLEEVVRNVQNKYMNILEEKESFKQKCEEEKCGRDALEKEQCSLSEQMKELSQTKEAELSSKNEEVVTLQENYRILQQHYEEKGKDISEITLNLNKQIENILQNLNQHNFDNKIMEKLMEGRANADNLDVNITMKVLTNLFEVLAMELVVKSADNFKLEEKLKEVSVKVIELNETISKKDMEVSILINQKSHLLETTSDANAEFLRKNEVIQCLKKEIGSLENTLEEVRIQSELKVNSLKGTLADSDNLMEKVKKNYDLQVENFNIVSEKLTNYVKDKSSELDVVHKEKEHLQQLIEDNKKVIKSLEDELKSRIVVNEKLIQDFDNERQVLKNMVTVTENVMEDQEISLNKVIADHVKENMDLREEIKALKESISNEIQKTKDMLKEKDSSFEYSLKELNNEKDANKILVVTVEQLNAKVAELIEEIELKNSQIGKLTEENIEFIEKVKEIEILRNKNSEVMQQQKILGEEFNENTNKLMTDLEEENRKYNMLMEIYNQKETEIIKLSDNTQQQQITINELKEQLTEINKIKDAVEIERNYFVKKVESLKEEILSSDLKEKETLEEMKKENNNLENLIEEHKSEIINLENKLKQYIEEMEQLRKLNDSEKFNLMNKCSLLEEYQMKAEKQFEDKDKKIAELIDETKTLRQQFEEKNDLEHQLMEKDSIVNTVTKKLLEMITEKELLQRERDIKSEALYELKQIMSKEINEKDEAIQLLQKENDDLAKAVSQKETFAIVSQDKGYGSQQKHSDLIDKELRDVQRQVDMSPIDFINCSDEKGTITDLEKIVQNKNRIITTLQSDITYLKTLMAESENKLLDVNKELENCNENCQQLSSHLKQIVNQKNEEIADLKRQVSKMSLTDTRATQIIKVSAKYQAIILKRIQEIKNNTVLKELTNFGNAPACDIELKRSLNAGAITMEELENFLETTDRHLRRCSEKQISLQKERDRLSEVCKINESEIISMKKFLTELSVYFKTFSSIKELYTQKLSRVISIQRTVRREILNLDGELSDAMMFKLERGYTAVIQDLAECTMNLERWVERCIGRTISPEKIKQAFTSESFSMSPENIQNASLEVQLGEIGNNFQKLLEEISCAKQGECVRDAQSATVMEVRAEYEDKLNRMKAKMKQLYQEQITIFREKQRDEIVSLETEVQRARDKLTESSKAYEEHIRGLTTELWNVGEKFLMKKDEAEWLRRKQVSGSLMSLQHVHSSGLLPLHEDKPRPSDTHSLRSLPGHNKTEGRALHMSDEEGEVFDNRWLKELAATPRGSGVGPRGSGVGPRGSSVGPRGSGVGPGLRLSELRWRNSLCPPHLKSSYPAETQFAPILDEEEIKSVDAPGGRQRKEVGITAYKKPGPPTPSKQAGRLSATDSELRESLRPDVEPAPVRKTGTPSRLRALFRSSRTDSDNTGTPRSRRLSIFRSKK